MGPTRSVIVQPCWGCDTNTKLTAAGAAALARADYNGHPMRFVWRYVPLPGNSAAGDIDAVELDAIVGAGLLLLLVQHCRKGSWLASGDQGRGDGALAAAHAKGAGYVDGGCIALDLESVANGGLPVAAHCDAWCQAVIAGGYRPVVYVGFSCGLTPDQLYELPFVDRYWSDYGQRRVSTRGFCCRQYPQTTIAGISVDPDQALTDNLGGDLVAVGLDLGATQPDLPAIVNA
jgi:hypothetical protein